MTVEKIKSAIYKYGYYPALVFLKQEQDSEHYENCEIIKQALDEVGRGLSSKVDEKSIMQTYSNILKTSSNPELIENNMAYYIESFITEIKN